MSIDSSTKINQLLRLQPAGVVVLTNWLCQRGYSHGLQKRYRESNWFESIGSGAMIRTGDEVGYEGAIYAFQHQAGSSIHPGGRTALGYLGKSQYLEIAGRKVTVFGARGETLPGWFKSHDWGLTVEYHQSTMLPPFAGLISVSMGPFSISVSSAARAMLEFLYLANEENDLIEALGIMENLNNLRPASVQELLEQCRSVRVKRLFLYLAEKAGHGWFRHLQPEKIDLGSGKRSLVANGAFVAKYGITVPKKLESDD